MSIDKDTPATDWHAGTSSSSVRRVFITDYLDLPARLLMSILFLMSGVGKLTAVAATQGYMEAYGVAGVLIWPAAALEIGGGLMLDLVYGRDLWRSSWPPGVYSRRLYSTRSSLTLLR
jgi:DoxX